MRERRQHNPTGAILVTALFTAATIGVLLGPMMTRSMTELRATERFVESQQAFYLAEAGVDHGWTLLSANPSLALPAACPVTTFPGSVTSGCAMTSQADGTILVTGVGSVAGIQKTIQAVVEFQTTSVFQWALFADATHMHFHGGGLIDSYDSSVGAYDPTAPKDPHGAPVATNRTNNGAIAIENGAELWGDATVGVGGDPDDAIDTDGGGVIHGDRSAAASNVVLPTINFPSGGPTGFVLNSCPADPTIDVATFNHSALILPPNCQITLVGNGLIHLDDLDIGNGSSVQLQGDIQLSTRRLDLRNSSELRVDSGSAEIYVTERINIYQGNLANSTEIPSNFTLYVQGDRSVRLNSSTVFHGAIYVPDGEVRLFGNAEVFGSLVANHINAHNGDTPQLHYDRSLATLVTSTGFNGTLALRSWRQP